MHFFNPAQVMKLVEVVHTVSTAPDVTATVQDLCAQGRQGGRDLRRPLGVHRQRPALPVPQRRGEDARGQLRDGRRHRHRDEDRVRPADGPLRAARRRRASTSRWPSSASCTPSSASRATPRPRCSSTSSPRGTSAARPAAASAPTPEAGSACCGAGLCGSAGVVYSSRRQPAREERTPSDLEQTRSQAGRSRGWPPRPTRTSRPPPGGDGAELGSSREAGTVGDPCGDPSAIEARPFSGADRGFDAQEWTQVS